MPSIKKCDYDWLIARSKKLERITAILRNTVLAVPCTCTEVADGTSYMWVDPITGEVARFIDTRTVRSDLRTDGNMHIIGKCPVAYDRASRINCREEY